MYNIPNIVLLTQTEESSDLGSSLGTQSLRNDSISQAWDVTIALLDDREGEHRKVLTNNAASNRFALSLAGSSGSVAGVTVGEKELDSSGDHLWLQVSA